MTNLKCAYNMQILTNVSTITCKYWLLYDGVLRISKILLRILNLLKGRLSSLWIVYFVCDKFDTPNNKLCSIYVFINTSKIDLESGKAPLNNDKKLPVLLTPFWWCFWFHSKIETFFIIAHHLCDELFPSVSIFCFVQKLTQVRYVSFVN